MSLIPMICLFMILVICLILYSSAFFSILKIILQALGSIMVKYAEIIFLLPIMRQAFVCLISPAFQIASQRLESTNHSMILMELPAHYLPLEILLMEGGMYTPISHLAKCFILIPEMAYLSS